MAFHDFPLFARDDCQLPCPATPPPCICGINQQCVTILQGCNSCATPMCVDNTSVDKGSGEGGGVSKGAIAGGVVGALVLIGILVAAFFFYRRRSRSLGVESGVVNTKPDVPASAEAVLQREDPYEKEARQNTVTPAIQEAYQRYNEMMALAQLQQQQAALFVTAGAPPSSVGGPQLERRQSDGTVMSDPFKDNHSIQTTSASTQSTNVIPIHLVPHGSIQSSQSPASDRVSQTSSTPSRPSRDPNLNIDPLHVALNLDHVNLSKESFGPPNVPYAHSQASGFSGISNRTSVLTTGTYASDLLTEAPQIVTPASGAVRQFLGVAKAEVILAPGSNPSTPGSNYSSGRNPSVSRGPRAPMRSPLAQSSFGPGDSVAEAEHEGQDIDYSIHNPFGDENSFGGRSPTGTMSTMGMTTPVPLPSTASPTRHTHNTESPLDTPRPLSTATAAGSIIAADIGSATLIRLGSNASSNSANSARSQNRFTSAKLVSPMSAPQRQGDESVLQAQQAHALALARARAEASGLPGPGLNRRISEAGSVASNGGFSILESFTFVPPSPISSLPPRSPSSQRQVTPELSSADSSSNTSLRQVQGMSTVSNTSALAGYDFRIETDSLPVTPNTANIMQEEQRARSAVVPVAPSSYPSPQPAPAKQDSAGKQQRQRASLDTLALTADLSAFPLTFDEGLRNNFLNVTNQGKK